MTEGLRSAVQALLRSARALSEACRPQFVVARDARHDAYTLNIELGGATLTRAEAMVLALQLEEAEAKLSDGLGLVQSRHGDQAAADMVLPVQEALTVLRGAMSRLHAGHPSLRTVKGART